MLHKIKKNHHYGCPFPWPHFFTKLQQYHREISVVFSQNCAYDIDTDQSDVNKLFGISWGWHQHQSERIGWRYIPATNQMEICLYSYHASNPGKHKTTPICKVELGTETNISLDVNVTNCTRITEVIVNGQRIKTLSVHEPKWISYTLGLYFGGNRKAPHTMILEITEH